ncbi:SDR family oxidoreductase [Hoyosella rhizosphaerae]|uniref:NADP-dependent 3-hydroxy acid dehydrogenase YdfG n=1 Tax=Hoyosella rhizosphaerae TaxID=1755582 RepID=A0A916XH12_9ACTN|nr:mycolate reductase [Hoyosella rhizosphaerae]MBN4928145.1 SDR family oxidoreductase [Hoyosella rhizosphaerae]GGC72754.1 putative short chain dehydrogenase/reductase [Hoyosella rhizosphaerae]
MAVPHPTAENVAVVTGASSGIGTALAEDLAARGYNLIIVARRVEVLEGIATRLHDKYGVTVEVRGIDLADREQRKPLADELSSKNVAILCLNAGIATFGPLERLDPDYERFIVDLNAVSVHDLALAALPGMVERGGGGILMTGSAAGNMPIPNNATYAATKAFVNSFSESLRGEVKSRGIHVTLLAPGPVRLDAPEPEDASLVDRVVPDFLWIDTKYTARLSIDGLFRNKMRVVPGVLSKAMSAAGQYSPRGVMAPIVGSIYKKLGGE